MNREQKMSWLVIWTFAAGLAIFAVLALVTGQVWPSLGGFGIVGVSGLGPIIFRKPKGDVVEVDERDKAICRKATLGGAMISYGTFILVCMATWKVYRWQGREVISIHALPLIVFAGGTAMYLARSITLLVLYGREDRHAEKDTESLTQE